MRHLDSPQEALRGLQDTEYKMMRKTGLMFGILFGVIIIILSMPSVFAAEEATVCCEATTSGLFCQDVPAEECAPGSKQVPTACESTSFCSSGTCFDSSEGTCLDNTPQLVCNDNGGVWSKEEPAQCGLGCCTLGDQAAFVTLTRCKKLSSFLGLETNYNSGLQNEVQCVLSVAFIFHNFKRKKQYLNLTIICYCKVITLLGLAKQSATAFFRIFFINITDF